MGDPYRDEGKVSRTPVDWTLLAHEIADVPGGIAVLRILQGCGVDRLVQAGARNETLGAFNSIEHMITMVHEARRAR